MYNPRQARIRRVAIFVKQSEVQFRMTAKKLRDAGIAVLEGYVIGLANIIPGVSGGTMALVLGIYKRLIDALNNIDMETARVCLRLLLCRKGSFAEFKLALRRMDFAFLAWLGVGVLAAKSGMMWVKRLMLGSGMVAIVVGLVWINASWPF